MRIVVKNGNQSFRLILPTALVLNRLTTCILASVMRKYGAGISRRQLYGLLRAFKRYKRSHPQWKLVEAENADGGLVEIKI